MSPPPHLRHRHEVKLHQGGVQHVWDGEQGGDEEGSVPPLGQNRPGDTHSDHEDWSLESCMRRTQDSLSQFMSPYNVVLTLFPHSFRRNSYLIGDDVSSY